MHSRLPKPSFLTFSVEQLGYTLFKAVLASSAWFFVVFHDGLTETTLRTRIGAAINYLWIRLVSRFVANYNDRLILAYVGAITITVGFSRPQLDKYLTEAGYGPRGRKAALALMVLGALVAYFTQSNGPKEPQIANVYYRTLEITRGIGMICVKRSGTKTDQMCAVFVNAIVFFTCIQLAKQITSSTSIQLVLIYLCALAIRRSTNFVIPAPVRQAPVRQAPLTQTQTPATQTSVQKPSDSSSFSNNDSEPELFDGDHDYLVKIYMALFKPREPGESDSNEARVSEKDRAYLRKARKEMFEGAQR